MLWPYMLVVPSVSISPLLVHTVNPLGPTYVPDASVSVQMVRLAESFLSRYDTYG